jgi:Tol biopolymer transport system component
LPDGRTFAFLARSTDGVTRVWVRDLNALEARVLPGSENAANKFFWSFDGRFLVFESGGKIKRISLAGGPTTTLCDVPGALVGGFSTPEGVVIFGTTQVIYRVSWDGGRPEAVTRLDAARQETYHALPTPLPDGRHFLYLRVSSNPEQSGIFVGAVDATPEDPPSRRVLGTPFGARFVRTSATGPGQMLFLREGTLMHQGFDPGRMVLIGDAAPVVSPVGSWLAGGLFSASDDGTIVYRTDNPLNRQLAWFDRQGMKISAIGEPESYIGVAVAPDGAHAIATRSDAQTNRDLWLLDFTRATRSRFAFGQFRLSAPVWSPDSQRVVFQSNELGSFGLYEKPSAGATTERLLFTSAEGAIPTSVSPDGQYLLFHAGANSDLWLLPMSGNDAKAVPLLQTAFNEQDGRFSPDGRLIAWQSNESGSNEIYLGDFDAASPERFSTNERIIVSRGGGTGPRWRADGKELFYTSPDGKVMAVPVSTGAGIGSAIQAGTPVPLFTLEEGAVWEPAPDGRRFLELVPLAEARAPFNVLLNWAAGLTP